MAADEALDDCRDTAQQIVTACLHDDRDLAIKLVEEHIHPDVLALVLADLCCHVHDRWTRAVGGGNDEVLGGWQALMADVEEWRSSRD